MSVNPIRAGATSYPWGQALRPQSTAGTSLVLLVKDNEETFCDMKHVLELNGYRVMDTDNGQSAVAQRREVAIHGAWINAQHLGDDTDRGRLTGPEGRKQLLQSICSRHDDRICQCLR